MDPYVCCLLGICCPPFSAEQFSKLVALRMKHQARNKDTGPMSLAAAEEAVRFDLEIVKGVLALMKGKP